MSENLKIIISTLVASVIVVVVIVLIHDNIKTTEPVTDDNLYISDSTDNNEELTELTEKRLSDEYVILASGEDSEENEYELVATQYESASGVDIKIGVIKNNQWLVDLSNDTPFHLKGDNVGDKKGSLRCGCKTIYDVDSRCFGYVGNGCFACSSKRNQYSNIIYNSKTQKYVDSTSFSYHSNMGGMEFAVKTTFDEYQSTYINAEDGKIIGFSSLSKCLFVLDTNTMEIAETAKGIFAFPRSSHAEIFPYSNGLFGYVTGLSNVKSGFYDLSGNLVIDLSKYTRLYDDTVEKELGGFSYLLQPMVFDEDTCALRISNNLGSTFNVTFDKKGNIISENETY